MAGFDDIARRGRRTILAVDANPTNRGVLGNRLGEMGYSTLLSGHGREALAMIAGRGIDLVLIDIALAEPSGIDVLAELRGSRETFDLPVVMMTGRSDPQAAVRALTAGADDWIAKPFAFEELAARIDRTLARSARLHELKRTNAALDARIARRAIELGETRADRDRLIASLEAISASSAGARNIP